MNTRRVVITGIGVACAAGLGRQDYWESLRRGLSGITSALISCPAEGVEPRLT